jgi:PBSX family phage terminase large subunit
LKSQKYKDFITTDSVVDVLEGTTYAGKTTIAFGIKFIAMVKKTKLNTHLIAAESLGTIERNILNPDDFGLLALYGDEIQYWKSGHGNVSLPHLKIGSDTVYLLGYSDVAKFKKALGGQFGAVGVDEANIAHEDFIKEILLPRFEYAMFTGNPDDPSKKIYENVFDRARAIPKYADDIPEQIKIAQSKQIPVKGWHYWFFTYDDNAAITDDKRTALLESLPPTSIQYKTKIQGIRTKAEGLIYDMSNVNVVDSADVIMIDISIDSGYMVSATTATAYGLTRKRKIVVLDTYYFKPSISYKKAPSEYSKEIFEFYRKVAKKYKCPVDTWTIDSAEGALRAQFKLDYGIRIKPVAKMKKQDMIERAFDVLFDGIDVVRTKNNMMYWMPEHTNYAWDTRKSNEPIKENDHTCDNFQYYILANKRKLGI